MIFATIRIDVTVAAEMDCFCDSTVFTLVCEEAATLVLAGQHLVDFVDFNIAKVIFFRKVKCRPVVIVLEYVFDRKRGISSKTTEEKDEEAGSGCEDVWVHQLDLYCWVVVITDTARAWFFYSVYTKIKGVKFS